jgi:hypothetical protein
MSTATPAVQANMTSPKTSHLQRCLPLLLVAKGQQVASLDIF